MKGTSILLIDDNVELAANIAEILEDEGAIVRRAATAAEGLALARDPFDVALVDIRLPDGTGLELLPKLREVAGALPEFLLITGDATLEDAISAVQAGAYDYVVKPFDPMHLVTTLDRASRQVETRKEALLLSSQLAEREANLRTLVETVQVMLFTLDADAVIRSANSAAERRFQAAAGSLPGRCLFEFVPPRDHDELQRAMALLRDDKETSFEARLLGQSPERAEEFRIRWHWTPLRRGDGDLQIYASGLDVTKLSELERRTRLAEKLAAVGTLAAGLAHEIRNPLNSAELQLQLLERRLSKLELEETMRRKSNKAMVAVHQELGRLTNLVEEFLNFARPTELHIKEVELRRFFEEFVGFHQPQAAERGVVLRLDAPTSPVELRADPEKLKQIFLNITRNAIQAAGDDGEVRIQLDADGRGARVRVLDSGVGIPEADISRVFEPFYTTTEGGTGLGMAITHSLVALHGGDIDLENRDGGGLAVEVRLPQTPPLDRP